MIKVTVFSMNKPLEDKELASIKGSERLNISHLERRVSILLNSDDKKSWPRITHPSKSWFKSAHFITKKSLILERTLQP